MNTVSMPVDRPRAGRTAVADSTWTRLLGYAMVVAVLPYLGLKVLWVSGVMVGIPDGSPVREPGFVWANIFTGLLAAAAILVALALTHRWGQRLPAWLVLTPAWVGTGLLVPVVIALLNGAAAALVGDRAVSLAGGLVDTWTYLVVYTSFGLQGLLLTTAFVRYARRRWAALFDGSAVAVDPGPAHGVRVVLAGAGVVAAGVVAAAHLVLAFGPADGYRPGWEYTARSRDVVQAAMAALAVVGIRAMIRGRGPLWIALALTWTGTGAMFSYALITLVAVLVAAPGSESVTALAGLTHQVALIGGLLVAVTGLFHVAELLRPRPGPRVCRPLRRRRAPLYSDDH